MTDLLDSTGTAVHTTHPGEGSSADPDDTLQALPDRPMPYLSGPDMLTAGPSGQHDVAPADTAEGELAIWDTNMQTYLDSDTVRNGSGYAPGTAVQPPLPQCTPEEDPADAPHTQPTVAAMTTAPPATCEVAPQVRVRAASAHQALPGDGQVTQTVDLECRFKPQVMQLSSRWMQGGGQLCLNLKLLLPTPRRARQWMQAASPEPRNLQARSAR